MKTTLPPIPPQSYNEWMIYIYQQLNYPINDDGTKRETTQGLDSKTRIRKIYEPLRTTEQDRPDKKANRRRKS